MSVSLPGRPDAEFVVVLDCRDLDRVASFWATALGYRRTRTHEPYCSVVPPEGESGIEMLLQRVPDPKIGKNRLHLDLRVPDIDAEAARLQALGARMISTAPVEENGWAWHVLADPENNEFCVLRRPRPR